MEGYFLGMLISHAQNRILVTPKNAQIFPPHFFLGCFGGGGAFLALFVSGLVRLFSFSPFICPSPRLSRWRQHHIRTVHVHAANVHDILEEKSRFPIQEPLCLSYLDYSR